MLSKTVVKARPSVLWCYKKDLYLSRWGLSGGVGLGRGRRGGWTGGIHVWGAVGWGGVGWGGVGWGGVGWGGVVGVEESEEAL